MNRLILCFSCVSLLGAAACSSTPSTRPDVIPDSRSEGDDTLAGARGVFDEVIADSVDAPEGDNTDCKYIDVGSPGTLDVRVRFHEADVAGTVALLNEYGEMLREVPFDAGGDVRLDGFEVFPGRYYVRVRASEGGSDYSIGRELEPDPTWLSDQDTRWIEERLAEARALTDEGRYADARLALYPIGQRFPENPDVLAELETAMSEVDAAEERARLAAAEDDDDDGGHSGGTSDHGQGDDDTGTGGGDGDVDGDGHGDGVVSDADFQGFRARIVTVRDRGAGRGTVLVLTGCGSASGVGEGDEGLIEGTSHRAVVTRVTGPDACHAESDSSPGEVGSARHVLFRE